MQTLHWTSKFLSLAAILTLVSLPACSDSGEDEGVDETGDTMGDGDGDTMGDGDGDTTGDGDGDTTGDGDGDGDTGNELSFEADVYPIIMTNCSCHLAGAGTLSMPDASTAYDNLVNVAATHEPNLNRVEPGDSANSFLYQKVTATQAGLSVDNAQMPKTPLQELSANPLSDADMMTIADWIDGGAQP